MAKRRSRRTSKSSSSSGLGLVVIAVLVVIVVINNLLSNPLGVLIVVAVLLGISGLWLLGRTSKQAQSPETMLSSLPTPSSPESKTASLTNGSPVASSDRFVEILPGGRSDTRPSGVTISVSYETGGSRFLKEAQHFHDRVETSAEPVPFMEYWPTYSSMSAAQQRWYFYWRSQVRQNNYLPTDLSYIFIHVYELLNLVEIPDPVQAAGRLWVLWQKYRGQQPKLDNYLPDWGGDLLAVKKDVNTALLWWQKALEQKVSLSVPVTNALVQGYVQAGKTTEMPYTIWLQLTVYRPRNKFYQEYNVDNEIDNAYERAIRIAADYWQRTANQTLLEKFTSARLAMLRKPVFASAVIGYTYPQSIDLGQARNYLDNQRLSEHLTSVVKYAENILRKQKGFSRKLSGIELEAGLAGVLDTAFAPTVIAPEPLKITIDHTRVAALHQESAEIGAMLEISPDEAEVQRPVKALHTELAEVRQIWAELSRPERQVIAVIYRKEADTIDQLNDRLKKHALLPNTAIDHINERALPLLGDRLIYAENDGTVTLAEDFLDELDVVIAESPAEAEPAVAAVAATDGPWDQLFAKLPPAEVALIRLFAERGCLTEAEIDAATRPYRTMGNAALDGLNEKAVEIVGHPPFYLDTNQWIVEEEDLVALRQHLSG